MFDVGFSEVLLIAVVALLVLGPERLPKAARFAGLWIRRARGQWDSVRNELERELAAEELKASVARARAEAAAISRGMQQTEARLQTEVSAVQAGVAAVGAGVTAEVTALPGSPAQETTADSDPSDVPPGQAFSLEAPLPETAVPADVPASSPQAPRHD